MELAPIAPRQRQNMISQTLGIFFAAIVARPPTFAKRRARPDRDDSLACLNLIVTNSEFEGRRLGDLPVFDSSGIVVSRIKHHGYIGLATPEDIIHVRDTLLVVGPREEVDEFRILVGRMGRADLRVEKSGLVARPVLVTKRAAAGRVLADFDLIHTLRTHVTRVRRAGRELSATPDRRIELGDRLVLVGRAKHVTQAVAIFGRVDAD